MSLRQFTISGGDYPGELLKEAAGTVQRGGVLIHPTETIHGYGCRYDSSEAIGLIRRLKGRDEKKPMILLLPGRAWVEKICRDVPQTAYRLMDSFWPGALTIVLKSAESFRRECPWQSETVAVRQEAHPFTASLLELTDLPLVSTSLGRSGEPVPRDTLRFLRRLEEQFFKGEGPLLELAVVDLELEQKSCPPSTIIKAEEDGVLYLLREGALKAVEITQKTGIKVLQ